MKRPITERKHVIVALVKQELDVYEAARLLGCTTRTLSTYVKQYIALGTPGLEPVQNLFNTLSQKDMRKTYPSDISRLQFEKIRPLLEGARKKTKPRTHDLYDLYCGILYVLKSGCQWRMIPSDFPMWRTIHSYFQIWSEQKEGQPSILQQALKKNNWRGPHHPWEEKKNQLLHH